jgi:hypothetical protein
MAICYNWRGGGATSRPTWSLPNRNRTNLLCSEIRSFKLGSSQAPYRPNGFAPALQDRSVQPGTNQPNNAPSSKIKTVSTANICTITGVISLIH